MDKDRNPLKLVGLVNRTFARLVDAPLRELGFAIGQLPVLVSLKKRGALPQAELARIARVEQPSMAQLLTRMERDGLIRREADPADGRSRLVTLTERASRQMPKGKAVMDATCEQALAGFSDREREQLAALLERVLANLEAQEPPAA
jgi:DNA-binding MarR family transcriptional regulator